MRINQNTLVKTLKKEFKQEFGLTIRVYDGRNFADEESTLALIGKVNKALSTTFSPKRVMKIGVLVNKIMALYEVRIEVSGSSDNYICRDADTLLEALENDKIKEQEIIDLAKVDGNVAEEVTQEVLKLTSVEETQVCHSNGKIFFRGRAVIRNVTSISSMELQQIINPEGSYISITSKKLEENYIKLSSSYNILPECCSWYNNIDDIFCDVDFIPFYCSNIGEPSGNCPVDYYPTLEDVCDCLKSQFKNNKERKEFESTVTKNGQFKEGVLVDDFILNLVKGKKCKGEVYSETDLNKIENIVSTFRTIKGEWFIDAPKGFDVTRPIYLITHEVKLPSLQLGSLIMQYNGEKLLVDSFDLNYTKGQVVGSPEAVLMSEIEFDLVSKRLGYTGQLKRIRMDSEFGENFSYSRKWVKDKYVRV